VTLPAEGTLSFRLRVPEGYWRTSGEACRFPPLAADGLYVEVVITEAASLALAWDATGLVLCLDGVGVATVSA